MSEEIWHLPISVSLYRYSWWLSKVAQSGGALYADPGPMVHLGCGTFSGALGATCVYPLQLVRTRYIPVPV